MALKRSYLKRKTPMATRSRFNTKRPVVGAKKGKLRKAVTVSSLKKKLWALCRELIRLTHGNTCYTCGAINLSAGNWQTGHFITSSTCSAHMRYNLQNLRPQCYRCNISLSGNWVEFEKHLTRDGVDVQALKKENEKTKGDKYDAPWYQQKIQSYQTLLTIKQHDASRNITRAY